MASGGGGGGGGGGNAVETQMAAAGICLSTSTTFSSSIGSNGIGASGGSSSGSSGSMPLPLATAARSYANGGVAEIGLHLPPSYNLSAVPTLQTMRLPAIGGEPPVTVTTTTVASTTATATTTMASTSSLAASSPAGVGALAVAGALGGSRTADNMKFMPDVLVRRLVEKWWRAELQAKKINETAASCMHLNLLDDALKFCNASLEKAPTNFKSLCLRAEVLLKLGHFQSSLADVENALKARCNSPKAHYLRALALSGLCRLDEALYDGFLAICLDKTTNLSSSEIFQHDLAKILQRLLAQTPKCKPPEPTRGYGSKSSPYGLWLEQRMRRKKLASATAGDLAAFDVAYVQPFDYISAEEAEDSLFANALDYMDKRDVYELHHGKERYELEARRHATRKHCRRKWPTKQLALPLLPALAEEEAVVDDVMADVLTCRSRCNQLLIGIVERTQLELQRLKKLESMADAPHKQPTPVPTALIDASDFDCVVCYRTLWKPVVTPCGHTYCLVCLDRCMDYNSPCPLCMSPLVELNVNNMYQGSSSPVPFALAKRPVTKFLEAAMKRFIPDIYETRFRQEIDMEPSVPVFICTTAFPCVPCPLFVCEPRYRLMVRRAVESGEKTFGIVQPQSGKTRYFDVGTILDIRDCVLLGDGCSILSTIGCKRFKILARSEKDGYETAKVEYICDEPIADEKVPLVVSMHALVLRKAILWFESLSTEQKDETLRSFGRMPPLEDNWELLADGPAWAWWVIALLPLSPQLKVNILATTSLEKRLRAIKKTLDCLTGNYRTRAQQHQQHQQQQQHLQRRQRRRRRRQQQQQQQRHQHPHSHSHHSHDVDGEEDEEEEDVDVGVADDVVGDDVDDDIGEEEEEDDVDDVVAGVHHHDELSASDGDECCLRTNQAQNSADARAHASTEQFLL